MRHGLGSLAWALPGVLTAYSTLAASEFHESFDETRPPAELFQGQLFVGDADGWTGEIKKGTYFLIDRETPDATKADFRAADLSGAWMDGARMADYQGYGHDWNDFVPLNDEWEKWENIFTLQISLAQILLVPASQARTCAAPYSRKQT